MIFFLYFSKSDLRIQLAAETKIVDSIKKEDRISIRTILSILQTVYSILNEFIWSNINKNSILNGNKHKTKYFDSKPSIVPNFVMMMIIFSLKTISIWMFVRCVKFFESISVSTFCLTLSFIHVQCRFIFIVYPNSTAIHSNVYLSISKFESSQKLDLNPFILQTGLPREEKQKNFMENFNNNNNNDTLSKTTKLTISEAYEVLKHFGHASRTVGKSRAVALHV